MTITIIGSGYVGTTFAAILSNCGYKVYALDINPKIIESLKNKKAHFFEVGLNDFVKKGIESGNLIPTTSYKDSIANSDVVFSCVGTPDNPDGSSNLTYVFDSALEAAKYAKEGLIYVQKSTVPVGTGKRVLEKVKKANPNLLIHYISNPEFLREGSAVFDTFLTDRVVVGGEHKQSIKTVLDIHKKVSEYATKIDFSLYEEFANVFSDKIQNIDEKIKDIKYLSTSLESAELIKVTANAFLALKISFANSVAKLAQKFDADVNEVMDGVGSDARIGRSFLYAGLGWGGGCFPKDVSGLISLFEQNNIQNPIMDAAVSENHSMAAYLIGLMENELGSLKNKKIAILGLAFKSGTSDCRRSPSINLANELIKKGAVVSAFDPKANSEAMEYIDSEVKVKDSAEDLLKNIDSVVIATEWPEFKEYDWKNLLGEISTKTIFDARNILDKQKLQKIGYKYVGIGK